MIFLLFTLTKKSQMAKLEDLIKGIVEEWVKDFSKEMPIV